MHCFSVSGENKPNKSNLKKYCFFSSGFFSFPQHLPPFVYLLICFYFQSSFFAFLLLFWTPALLSRKLIPHQLVFFYKAQLEFFLLPKHQTKTLFSLKTTFMLVKPTKIDWPKRRDLNSFLRNCNFAVRGGGKAQIHFFFVSNHVTFILGPISYRICFMVCRSFSIFFLFFPLGGAHWNLVWHFTS